MESSWALRMNDKVIGPEKLKRISKNSWERKLENGWGIPKESNWAKDAQEEMNGTKEPLSNIIRKLEVAWV